jgi:hypothetical protein
MVKSLIWLECSSDKGTYIGIDKGSLDTPAPMSGIDRFRPFEMPRNPPFWGSESLVVRGGVQTFAHHGLAEGETGNSVAQAVKVSEATMVEWRWTWALSEQARGSRLVLPGL